ncbi:hypothetical protein J6590_032442 [Homalodisca vitripennis]|nr:hypothetical protein J6590_032442 [Homalodisca vitripennis]
MDVEGDDFNMNLENKLCIPVIVTLSEDCDTVGRLQKSYFLFDQFELWNETLQIWIIDPFKEDTEEENTYKDVERMFYAVQTSGSTGEPKIVQVPEKAIVPNINHLRNEFEITGDDVILLSTPPTFDPFMVEFLLALTSGASLLVVSQVTKASPFLFLDCVFPTDRTPLVTVMQLTPSVFMRWSPSQIQSRVLTPHTSLKVLALEDWWDSNQIRFSVLVIGGELFPSPEFWSLCKHPDNRTCLYNLYGITEVSCWASVAGPGIDLNLGSPLSNTLLRVEDDSGLEVTDGSGHLLIGSETRICLVGDENWSQLTPPVYRATGDIVAVKDGVYKYVGRRDNLIKRWGHRVCLDQVATVAAECEGVVSASCVLHADCLGLFVHLEENSLRLDSFREKLTTLLRSRLNKASVPDLILQVDQLPLNRHGKVNKNKLKQKLSEVIKSELKDRKPVDLFKALWRQYLSSESQEDVGFLNGGGNSVTAMQIVNRLKLPTTRATATVLAQMLNNSSLAECCRLVEASDSGGGETDTANVTRDDLERNQSVSKKAKIDSADKVMCIVMKGCSADSEVSLDSNFEMKIAWSYDLGKCVDASPTIIVYSSGRGCVVIGSHSGRLASLDLASGTLQWDLQLPDRIESSFTPSACATCGLVGCYDGKVYCVNMTNGGILWSYKTNAMVKAIPLLVGETWVFGSYDYNVYCLRVARVPTKKELSKSPLQASTLLLERASPSVRKGKVNQSPNHQGFFLEEDKVQEVVISAALNSLQKELLLLVLKSANKSPLTSIFKKSVRFSGTIFSTPCILTILFRIICNQLATECTTAMWDEDDRYIASRWSGRRKHGGAGQPPTLTPTLRQTYTTPTLDASLVWRHNMGGIIVTTPLHLPALGLVVVVSLGGQVVALKCASGEVKWDATLLSPVFSSPCVVAGVVVMAEVEGTLHAFLPESGVEVWKISVGGKIFSSLSVTGNLVLFGCHDNNLYCLRCSEHAIEMLWRQDAGSAVYATPVRLGPHYLAFATTEGLVYTACLHSGKIITSIRLPKEIFSSPVIYRDSLIIGCRDNSVYCLRFNKSSIV